MCRLYGFRASEPTRVECALVYAQNSLITQGIRDREGLTHGNGWGIAAYEESGILPRIEKSAWAAWHGEQFSQSAAKVFSPSIISHVRRATVGEPRVENSHPFGHESWTFAHNGTLWGFEEIKQGLLDAIDPLHRKGIAGSTDSEHIFRYLLTVQARNVDRPLSHVIRDTVQQLIRWARATRQQEEPGLNLLWTDGEQLVGTRLNRTLWYLERDRPIDCPICGESHLHEPAPTKYRSVEFASEPITTENWIEVPNGSVFRVTSDLRARIEPLGIS